MTLLNHREIDRDNERMIKDELKWMNLRVELLRSYIWSCRIIEARPGPEPTTTAAGWLIDHGT
jgi:hypothetical protein